MTIRPPGPGSCESAPAGFPHCGRIEAAWFPRLVAGLHGLRATGSLKVTSASFAKALYLCEGRILFASSNDPRDQLGGILVDRGQISRELLEDANARVGPGNPLAKVLAESGLVNERELQGAAREKVERILADILSWETGTFEFEDHVLPRGAVDLRLSAEKLLLAAIRRVADPRFALRHADPKTVLESMPGALVPSDFDTEVLALLARLDGRRSLADAGRLAGLGERDALTTACAMLLLGLVRRKDARTPAPGGGPRYSCSGLVEDVEDMRARLIRERDEARARVAELEKRLSKREAWRRFWRFWRTGVLGGVVGGLRRLVAEMGPAAEAGPAAAKDLPAYASLSPEDRAFIAQHLAEGRVLREYGFVDRACAQFVSVLARFPGHPEALREMTDLERQACDDATAVQRALASAERSTRTIAPVETGRPLSLAKLLARECMLTPTQLEEALEFQKKNRVRLSQAVVSLGFVRDEEITSLLSAYYNVPSIDLEHFEVDPCIIKIIPAEMARRHQVLPLSRSGATLTIAMADPSNAFAMDDIKFTTGYNVEPVVASESQLDQALARYYDPAEPRARAPRLRHPGNLRLAWSRDDAPDDDPEGGSPAA